MTGTPVDSFRSVLRIAVLSEWPYSRTLKIRTKTVAVKLNDTWYELH